MISVQIGKISQATMTLAVVAHKKNFPVVAYFFQGIKTAGKVKSDLKHILILSKIAVLY